MYSNHHYLFLVLAITVISSNGLNSSHYLFDKTEDKFVNYIRESDYNVKSSSIFYILGRFEDLINRTLIPKIKESDCVIENVTESENKCYSGTPKSIIVDGYLDFCHQFKPPSICREYHEFPSMDISCQLSKEDVSDRDFDIIKESFKPCQMKSHKTTIDERHCKLSTGFMEKTIDVLLLNKKWIYVDGLQMTIDHSVKDINSYECKTVCKIEECRSGLCNGDHQYCTVFSCNRESKCYCKYKDLTSSVEGKIKGIKVKPKCWGKIRLSASFELPKTDMVLESSCKDCKFTCFKNGIQCSFPSEVPKSLRICKSPSCIEKIDLSSETLVKATKDQMKSFGDFKAEVWFYGRTKPTEILIKCDSHLVCHKECFWCLENFFDVECYNWKEWTIIIILFIMITFLTSYLKHKAIGFVVKKLRKSSSETLKITKTDKKMKEELKQELKVLKEERNRENLGQQVVREVEPQAPNPPQRQRGIRMTDFLFVIMVVLPGVIPCSDFKDITLDGNRCEMMENGKMTCTLQQTTRLSIAPIGQDSCFVIKSVDNKVIGQFKIRSNTIDKVCKKKILYYTPNARQQCKSVMRCGGQASCQDNVCANTQPDEEMEEWGSGNKNLGWTSCMGTPGCWANGCFICTEACLFYRAYFDNPSKEVYEVFDCNSWTNEIDLDLTFIWNGNSKEKKDRIKITSGIETRLPNMVFNLISVSVDEFSGTQKCFMRNGDYISMVDCNRRDEFSLGRVGEIQCPTKKDAELVSRRCFSTQSLIKTSEANNFLSCHADLTNIKHLQSNFLLPLNSENIIYKPKNQTVMASFKGSGIFELQIDFDNYKVQSFMEKNTCDLKLISSSGCFSCLRGAQLKFQGKTNFGSAIAIVECKTLNLKFPISLRSDYEFKNVTIHSDMQSGEETCLVHCPSSVSNVNITFNLYHDTSILGSRGDNEIASQISSKSSDWTNIFQISAFKTIITIFLILSSIILVVSIVFHFIKTK